MGVIISAILFVLKILGTALSRLLVDEFKERTPWLIEQLIQHAVGRLSQERQERYNEEWRSHIDEVPGQIGKLFVATGFLWAAHRMRPRVSTGPSPAKSLSETRSALRFFLAASLLYFCGLFLSEFAHGSLGLRFASQAFSSVPSILGMVVALRRERSLKSPMIFLYLEALVLPISIAVGSLLNGGIYFYVYWMTSIFCSLILYYMILEIVVSFFSSGWRKFLVVPWLTALIYVFAIVGPQDPVSPSAFMFRLDRGIATCSCVADVLLILLMFTGVHWTKEKKMVAAGIMAYVLPSIFVFHGPTKSQLLLFRSACGLFYMASVMLLSMAGSPRPRTIIKGTQET